jgi:hypothetical protein
MLVDGTPEPMLFPGDADDDLIEVPFVATARRSLPDAVGEYPPEFEAPVRLSPATQPIPATTSLRSLPLDPKPI